MASKTPNDELIDQIQIVEYSDPGVVDPVQFRLDPGTETIWATQAQISELFGTERSNVTKHLGNIFDEGELEQNSNVKKMHIAGSSKPVSIYSLDAVLSVGYRVNTKAATRFRQWATGTLKAFIEQGFVLNERVLRDSPEKLNALAAQIRLLRAEEKQVYARVTDCFKISASDYQPSSKEVRRFYALLQDKFHFAVTDMTSSKLILDRADHTLDNMGVQTFSGSRPTKAEALIGKNYLTEQELYRLHILSEQFLLFAEATALKGKKMTMESLHVQLDRILILNDYSVFEGWPDYLKDRVKKHVEFELSLFRARQKVEATGIAFTAEDMAAGEYAEIL